jgi:hypothetical protein
VQNGTGKIWITERMRSIYVRYNTQLNTYNYYGTKISVPLYIHPGTHSAIHELSYSEFDWDTANALNVSLCYYFCLSSCPLKEVYYENATYNWSENYTKYTNKTEDLSNEIFTFMSFHSHHCVKLASLNRIPVLFHSVSTSFLQKTASQ